LPDTDDFLVRFWGVRGSIACPGPSYARYGGNTSCLEVRCGPHLLIFDGGTGLRPLGESLNQMPVDADLFFTHSHFDHIAGLPFFKALFKKENRLRLWAGHLLPDATLQEVIGTMMKAPLFPVPMGTFTAAVTYQDFRAGDELSPRPGVKIATAPLNHPNNATGYRINYRGRSICYVTDTEHKPGSIDRNIAELCRDADIFIYDCSYTDDEYPRYAGWGHSTWQEGARLADASGVKLFVIFHHDPSHDDAAMDAIADAAAKRRPGSIVAREGMILRP
jgi:phosphoribosyl 1,2-cyclic phosphodiesterase